MTTTVQAGIRTRVLPRFPAKVETGAGLEVAKSGGTYTFSFDYTSLPVSTTIADITRTYVPAYKDQTGDYVRLTAEAFGQAMGPAFAGTSSSTVSVGTGSKSFTASTARAWSAGQRLRVANSDDSKVMSGIVASYDAQSGALVLTVDYTLGSGSASSWTITIGGERGATGEDGAGTGDVVGPAGSTDGYFALFDSTTGKLLKESASAPGALAYQDTVSLATDVTGDLPFANIAQIATDRLVGRDTAGTGDIEALTVGGGLEFTGSGGIRRSALTGDVSASAGSNTTAIGAGKVTFTMVASAAIASQAEAEAGTATTKLMTPQRTKQAIDALASAQGIKLLNSGSVSGSATLDIVLTSYTAYRALLIKLINIIPATDNVDLRMRTSTNGGSSYDSGGSDYRWGYLYVDYNSSGNENSSGPTSTITIWKNQGNSTGEHGNVDIQIDGQTNTGTYGKFTTRGMFETTSTLPVHISGFAVREASADIDAVRFYYASGNIASCTWALYGYA